MYFRWPMTLRPRYGNSGPTLLWKAWKWISSWTKTLRRFLRMAEKSRSKSLWRETSFLPTRRQQKRVKSPQKSHGISKVTKSSIPTKWLELMLLQYRLSRENSRVVLLWLWDQNENVLKYIYWLSIMTFIHEWISSYLVIWYFGGWHSNLIKLDLQIVKPINPQFWKTQENAL